MTAKKVFNILLALVFLEMIITATPAQSAVSPTNAKSLFAKMDRTSSWEYYKSRVDDSLIAWDESYLLRAYLFMYEATGDKQYLDEFTGHADTFLTRRDSVRGVKDYRGLSLPAWRSGKYTDYKQYVIYAVQTGLTITPLALFAADVKKDPSLTAYQSRADKYLAAAEDAIAIHDMRDKPQYYDVNCRWYEEGDTMHLDRPINMNLAMGSAMLAVYQATGDSTYLTKATKIANYFKQYLILNSSTNSYKWNYYPDDDQYGKMVEDMDHSLYDIEFVSLAYQSGIFSSTEMERFANTASKVMVKSDGTISARVDGTGTTPYPGFISNWLYFYKWAPSLVDETYKILSAKSSLVPKELCGLGLLNKVLSNNIPEPTPTTDTQQPQVSVTAPAEGSVLTDDSTMVQAAASDNKGVSSLAFSYSVDQNNWIDIGNAEPAGGDGLSGTWKITWDIKNLQDGSYYLRAIAKDAAGNTTVSTPVACKINHAANAVDTQNPRVELTSPAANSVLTNESAALQASASDNKGVGSLSFSYSVDQQNWTGIGLAELAGGDRLSGTWKITWDIKDLKDGVYYLRAIARDDAGNTTVSTSVACDIKHASGNLIVNGDFSQGIKGWVNLNNSAKVNSTNGNYYLTNKYNWDFYQNLNLSPGTYKLTARTKKGTSAKGARIVIQFRFSNGTKTAPYDFGYKNAGTGWESMPAMTIKVPAGASVTRIYLLSNVSGTQHFDDLTLTAI